MSKLILEQRTGQTITDAEFAIIMEITTDDIKFNRVSFKKYTNLEYVINIAVRAAQIFKACA